MSRRRRHRARDRTETESIDHPQLEPGKNQQFPLAQTALDWLKHGADEKYELRLHGEEALALALKALFSSGLDPKPPIELLLGLTSTLHFEWSSPTAARLIVGVLIDSPKVRALFGLGDDKNEYLARGNEFLEGSKTKLLRRSTARPARRAACA